VQFFSRKARFHAKIIALLSLLPKDDGSALSRGHGRSGHAHLHPVRRPRGDPGHRRPRGEGRSAGGSVRHHRRAERRGGPGGRDDGRGAGGRFCRFAGRTLRDPERAFRLRVRFVIRGAGSGQNEGSRGHDPAPGRADRPAFGGSAADQAVHLAGRKPDFRMPAPVPHHLPQGGAARRGACPSRAVSGRGAEVSEPVVRLFFCGRQGRPTPGLGHRIRNTFGRPTCSAGVRNLPKRTESGKSGDGIGWTS